MDITRESLTNRFKKLHDDELKRRLDSGGLTELAQEVAREELSSRGITYSPVITTSAEIAESSVAGDLVPIARYLEPAEATVLQAVLDAEGIPAFFADTHMATTNYLLSTATGGIRILVPASHLQVAHEILEAIRRGDYALADDEDVATQFDGFTKP